MNKLANFTHNHYRKFLNLGIEKGYQFVPVEIAIQSDVKNEKKMIALRHDVDRIAFLSQAMAKVENETGVVSTYYFRWNPRKGFPLSYIDNIAGLGHNIGYHYETLSQMNGNQEQALNLFLKNLEKLKANYNCKTVCAHGAPFSNYDNNDLLKNFDYPSYNLLGDASLSISSDDYLYFTDVGGRWNSTLNFRDKIAGKQKNQNVTPLYIVQNNIEQPMYINIHPERWSPNIYIQPSLLAKEGTTNILKYIFRKVKNI